MKLAPHASCKWESIRSDIEEQATKNNLSGIVSIDLRGISAYQWNHIHLANSECAIQNQYDEVHLNGTWRQDPRQRAP